MKGGIKENRDEGSGKRRKKASLRCKTVIGGKTKPGA